MNDPRDRAPSDALHVAINGDLVNGDQFKNYYGPRVIIPAGTPETVPVGWSGGADVRVGAHVYLLCDPFLRTSSSPDHSVLYREALALRVARGPGGRRARPRGRGSEAAPDHRYAWLRQVRVREETAAARAELKTLAVEREYLTRLSGQIAGLPRVLHMETEPDGRTATLAVAWPSSRKSQEPFPALETLLEPGGAAMDPFRMFDLFRGLAHLCDTLAALHTHGVAHRRLTPSGIIMCDGGRVKLRDLGLAAREPRAGEGPPDGQAPEQRHGRGARPGPKTDVYQVAALTHHLLTGRPPAVRAPLPLRRQAPDVPDRISHVLDAALASDPDARPDAAVLGAAFRAARADLSRGNDDVSPGDPPRIHQPRP
ncbi:hypothetical protein [Actinomadura rayongensis]|uniref:non-specific serine/threonine protein kinase n=1 Tax=Actinomadura rayongensis TaxID=1429076 RepID=A0A6I4WHC0_9ACTN|nr:hypothetical protein [Actinomadura rayongensis]MXQ65962.1 hypothetical protein [Actinomadura rayongensis]